jgi:hypothetical protein
MSESWHSYKGTEVIILGVIIIIILFCIYEDSGKRDNYSFKMIRLSYLLKIKRLI